METAIRQLLIDDSAVSAMIDTRVFDSIIPQGQPYPAIAYQRVTTQRLYTQDGESNFYQASLQLTCLAAGKALVEQLVAAVTAVLTGFAGIVGGFTIHSIFIDDESDTELAPLSGQDHNIRGKQLDLQVTWSQ